MERRIPTLLVFGVLVVGVAAMGVTKYEKQQTKVELTISHPEECVLLLPKALTAGDDGATPKLSITTGEHRFVFDCEGREYVLTRKVKQDQHYWSVDPRVEAAKGIGWAAAAAEAENSIR